MFRVPVSVYMTHEPATVAADTQLEQVADLLERRRISAMPVVDPQGRTVGIVSRRDLLRVGRLETVEGRSTPEWHLPDQVASDVMSSQIIAVAPNTSIAEAAGLMLDNQTHRVFIDAERRLKGVLTTRDVMQAIVDVRLDAPIERYLSSPVETIANFEPLAAARAQLEALDVRGLVVAEEGLPVGIFCEREALASRHRDADTPVDHVMGHEVLVHSPDTPAHRAAARMASMHARRVVAMKHGEMVGILTEVDLAGAAAIGR